VSGTSEGPLVTVLIPMYNAAGFISEAVRSVIAQTVTDWECIVIDDGSTDGSGDVAAAVAAEDSRIRVVAQDNGGKANALNHGLGLASGRFVCILDADDVSNPGRLEAQSAALLADPELGASFCPQFRPADRVEVEARVARMANPAHDPTIMWRRDLGIGFADELDIVEGEDHIMRIGEQHPMVVVAGCHYGYRLHQGNNSRAHLERSLYWQREMIRRACERRGIPIQDVANRRAFSGRSRVANTVGDAVDSTLELRALGERRRAVRDTARFARLGWPSLRALLPLCYALVPRWLLRLKRPDLDRLPGRAVSGEATWPLTHR
jgi:glycosyltransferase involved in cell wall biosynthesis